MNQVSLRPTVTGRCVLTVTTRSHSKPIQQTQSRCSTNTNEALIIRLKVDLNMTPNDSLILRVVSHTGALPQTPVDVKIDHGWTRVYDAAFALPPILIHSSYSEQLFAPLQPPLSLEIPAYLQPCISIFALTFA
jgi:hypothetical protein